MTRIVLAAVVALAVGASGGALAQPAQQGLSVSLVLPGCREFIANTGVNYIVQGYCAGAVAGIRLHVACPPPGLDTLAMVHVVVAYIDARPAVLGQDFLLVTTLALAESFPCRR